MKHQDNLIGYIEQSLRDNWELPAMSDFKGATLQYRDVARRIAKLHLLFEHAGVRPGDKIALCGRNCSQWAVTALASLTYGAVAVPILHDFKSENVNHLVNHSDARLLFADAEIWDSLDPERLTTIQGALLISDFSLLFSRNKRLSLARAGLNRLFGDRYPARFGPENVTYRRSAYTDLCLINYTSGSMGFSKGVMLSYRSLWSNVQFSIDGLKFLKPGDSLVSMLPLAHMFGFTVELLHPFVKGCHINFLNRVPSPRIIMEAFAAVKPKLIVAVPLIIEKVVKTKVFPLLHRPMMRVLLHTPVVHGRVLAKIRAQLINAFGGNLRELIIGGAGLNKDVETFLRRIKFPYTVGYGMTECGPLIAYLPWDRQKPGSCGAVVDRMEMKIDSPDPFTVPGVLYVRGDNVMQGYYKNPQATAAAIGKDGWMDTGDICMLDPDGRLYIRGRAKSMILGPSGQNIYPEEIEQQLNNLPYVAESLVVDNSGKLVTLIFPDLDAAAKNGMDHEAVSRQMEENMRRLNTQLPAYSRVSDFKLQSEEFEKTPKRSIKRYLYQH